MKLLPIRLIAASREFGESGWTALMVSSAADLNGSVEKFCSLPACHSCDGFGAKRHDWIDDNGAARGPVGKENELSFLRRQLFRRTGGFEECWPPRLLFRNRDQSYRYEEFRK